MATYPMKRNPIIAELVRKIALGEIRATSECLGIPLDRAYSKRFPLYRELCKIKSPVVRPVLR